MKIINQKLLDDLSAQAAENPRLRKNYNLHPSDDFCCHRLFNALEPGTYIRPHRHLDPLKDETFVIIRGRLGVITFDDNGTVAETALLSAGGDAVAADVPHGVVHTAVSLERGTIFFEAKAGPYHPLTDKEMAPWAPEGGTPEAAGYLEFLKGLF
ncbi:MAG: WbuC family cupin fold metalloprotein [Geobacteraceae bacterium]|nr:WbuC family cupin fold metalloprotein [Geobacteraceae bacterium]